MFKIIFLCYFDFNIYPYQNFTNQAAKHMKLHNVQSTLHYLPDPASLLTRTSSHFFSWLGKTNFVALRTRTTLLNL